MQFTQSAINQFSSKITELQSSDSSLSFTKNQEAADKTSSSSAAAAAHHYHGPFTSDEDAFVSKIVDDENFGQHENDSDDEEMLLFLQPTSSLQKKPKRNLDDNDDSIGGGSNIANKQQNAAGSNISSESPQNLSPISTSVASPGKTSKKQEELKQKQQEKDKFLADKKAQAAAKAASETRHEEIVHRIDPGLRVIAEVLADNRYRSQATAEHMLSSEKQGDAATSFLITEQFHQQISSNDDENNQLADNLAATPSISNFSSIDNKNIMMNKNNNISPGAASAASATSLSSHLSSKDELDRLLSRALLHKATPEDLSLAVIKLHSALQRKKHSSSSLHSHLDIMQGQLQHRAKMVENLKGTLWREILHLRMQLSMKQNQTRTSSETQSHSIATTSSGDTPSRNTSNKNENTSDSVNNNASFTNNASFSPSSASPSANMMPSSFGLNEDSISMLEIALKKFDHPSDSVNSLLDKGETLAGVVTRLLDEFSKKSDEAKGLKRQVYELHRQLSSANNKVQALYKMAMGDSMMMNTMNSGRVTSSGHTGGGGRMQHTLSGTTTAIMIAQMLASPSRAASSQMQMDASLTCGKTYSKEILDDALQQNEEYREKIESLEKKIVELEGGTSNSSSSRAATSIQQQGKDSNVIDGDEESNNDGNKSNDGDGDGDTTGRNPNIATAREETHKKQQKQDESLEVQSNADSDFSVSTHESQEDDDAHLHGTSSSAAKEEAELSSSSSSSSESTQEQEQAKEEEPGKNENENQQHESSEKEETTTSTTEEEEKEKEKDKKSEKEESASSTSPSPFSSLAASQNSSQQDSMMKQKFQQALKEKLAVENVLKETKLSLQSLENSQQEAEEKWLIEKQQFEAKISELEGNLQSKKKAPSVADVATAKMQSELKRKLDESNARESELQTKVFELQEQLDSSGKTNSFEQCVIESLFETALLFKRGWFQREIESIQTLLNASRLATIMVKNAKSGGSKEDVSIQCSLSEGHHSARKPGGKTGATTTNKNAPAGKTGGKSKTNAPLGKRSPSIPSTKPSQRNKNITNKEQQQQQQKEEEEQETEQNDETESSDNENETSSARGTATSNNMTFMGMNFAVGDGGETSSSHLHHHHHRLDHLGIPGEMQDDDCQTDPVQVLGFEELATVLRTTSEDATNSTLKEIEEKKPKMKAAITQTDYALLEEYFLKNKKKKNSSASSPFVESLIPDDDDIEKNLSSSRRENENENEKLKHLLEDDESTKNRPSLSERLAASQQEEERYQAERVAAKERAIQEKKEKEEAEKRKKLQQQQQREQDDAFDRALKIQQEQQQQQKQANSVVFLTENNEHQQKEMIDERTSTDEDNVNPSKSTTSTETPGGVISSSLLQKAMSASQNRIFSNINNNANNLVTVSSATELALQQRQLHRQRSGLSGRPRVELDEDEDSSENNKNNQEGVEKWWDENEPVLFFVHRETQTEEGMMKQQIQETSFEAFLRKQQEQKEKQQQQQQQQTHHEDDVNEVSFNSVVVDGSSDSQQQADMKSPSSSVATSQQHQHHQESKSPSIGRFLHLSAIQSSGEENPLLSSSQLQQQQHPQLPILVERIELAYKELSSAVTSRSLAYRAAVMERWGFESRKPLEWIEQRLKAMSTKLLRLAEGSLDLAVALTSHNGGKSRDQREEEGETFTTDENINISSSSLQNNLLSMKRKQQQEAQMLMSGGLIVESSNSIISSAIHDSEKERDRADRLFNVMKEITPLRQQEEAEEYDNTNNISRTTALRHRSTTPSTAAVSHDVGAEALEPFANAVTPPPRVRRHQALIEELVHQHEIDQNVVSSSPFSNNNQKKSTSKTYSNSHRLANISNVPGFEAISISRHNAANENSTTQQHRPPASSSLLPPIDNNKTSINIGSVQQQQRDEEQKHHEIAPSVSISSMLSLQSMLETEKAFMTHIKDPTSITFTSTTTNNNADLVVDDNEEASDRNKNSPQKSHSHSTTQMSLHAAHSSVISNVATNRIKTIQRMREMHRL